MGRILLGVTGSVAAIRTPQLASQFGREGHRLRILATEPSLYFFEPAEVDADLHADALATTLRLPPKTLLRDADEWPGKRYRRDDTVLHIALRDWADLLVVAPLDANTLAKFALGLADNALSCLFRAWDFRKPVLLAPAMNTRMWESPVTLRHLRLLLEDRGDGRHPAQFALDDAPGIFETHCPSIAIMPPQSKRLACGDFGNGAMAEVLAIVEGVRRSLSGLPGDDA